jgi:hypothetical protein
MNTKIIITAILIATLIGLTSVPFLSVQAQSPTPTPTYDPFAEPPLPENPNPLELGRHTFWHHCMPCHGDVGQGLTDAFRLQWEPDHQNCWARGCHSGRYANDSFPVPTIVPALASPGLLARYSPDSLFEYLRSTHPPQDPGLLTDNEYRALIAFLYDLNDAQIPAENATATPAPSSTPRPSASPTPTSSLPPPTQADSHFGLWSAIGLTLLLTSLLLLLQKRKK